MVRSLITIVYLGSTLSNLLTSPSGRRKLRFQWAHLRTRPPTTAIVQINAAMVPPIFQLVAFATVSKDGRLTAGPANKSAAAAPGGAPAASNPSASGISKNVGSATRTEMKAVAVTTRNVTPF